MLLLSLLSWLALTVPGVVADRADTIVRAARTFVQTGLGLLLAAMASGALDVSVSLNLLAPAVVAGATVVHAAVQPAER